jgi:hypothetical protein
VARAGAADVAVVVVGAGVVVDVRQASADARADASATYLAACAILVGQCRRGTVQ